VILANDLTSVTLGTVSILGTGISYFL